MFLAGFSLKHPGTLRIPRRWVLNILKWSNESRMPRNNGPRRKLGYDTCVSPFSTQMSPNIIREEEIDVVHANHNDHDEGELINIV